MTKEKKPSSHKILLLLGACSDASQWVGKRTPEKSWEECERGDWLLWCAATAGVDRKLVVQASCQCARLSLKYVPEGELRPLKAIETAEAWTRGEVTLEEVEESANAANAACDAANAANAVYATNATTYAAYAACAAAKAVCAANATNAAAHAAAAKAVCAANATAARNETLAECAVIVRKLISFNVVMSAINTLLLKETE